MKNKGQVLVCFIILLPIFIALLALVIDLGYMMIKTYEVKDTVKEALEYGVINNDIESIKIVLDKNGIDDYSISNNGNIEVTVNGSYKAIFGNIFNKDIYKYHFKYIGFMDKDEIIIKEG